LSACNLFPCDVNAVNCTNSGLRTNTTADRICGPCRQHYEQEGDRCIDIALAETSLEAIASGNAEHFSSIASAAVLQRFQNQDAIDDLVTITEKIIAVSFRFVHHSSQFILFLLDRKSGVS
jgi:hypothetical protein